MADFENSPDLTKLMTVDPTGLSDDDAMTLAALLVDLSADTASAGGLDRAEAVLTTLEAQGACAALCSKRDLECKIERLVEIEDISP